MSYWCGPGNSSQYSETLRPGRSEDLIPVRTRFFQPFSSTLGSTQPPLQGAQVSSLRARRPECGVDHPRYPASRLNSRALSILSLWNFVACSMVKFSFLFDHIGKTGSSTSWHTCSTVWIFQKFSWKIWAHFFFFHSIGRNIGVYAIETLYCDHNWNRIIWFSESSFNPRRLVINASFCTERPVWSVRHDFRGGAQIACNLCLKKYDRLIFV
jgi:hypothetical protein